MYTKIFLWLLCFPLTVISVQTDYKPSPEVIQIFSVFMTSLAAYLIRKIEMKEVIKQAEQRGYKQAYEQKESKEALTTRKMLILGEESDKQQPSA